MNFSRSTTQQIHSHYAVENKIKLNCAINYVVLCEQVEPLLSAAFSTYFRRHPE